MADSEGFETSYMCAYTVKNYILLYLIVLKSTQKHPTVGTRLAHRVPNLALVKLLTYQYFNNAAEISFFAGAFLD